MQNSCTICNPIPSSSAENLHGKLWGMNAATHKIWVGRRLRIAIDTLGLPYADVSRAFGVSQPKLGNWMRGDDYPHPWFVKQFCDRHNITADWLYRGSVSAALARTVADALWAEGQASGVGMEEETPPALAIEAPKNRRTSATSP